MDGVVPARMHESTDSKWASVDGGWVGEKWKEICNGQLPPRMGLGDGFFLHFADAETEAAYLLDLAEKDRMSARTSKGRWRFLPTAWAALTVGFGALFLVGFLVHVGESRDSQSSVLFGMQMGMVAWVQLLFVRRSSSWDECQFVMFILLGIVLVFGTDRWRVGSVHLGNGSALLGQQSSDAGLLIALDMLVSCGISNRRVRSSRSWVCPLVAVIAYISFSAHSDLSPEGSVYACVYAAIFAGLWYSRWCQRYDSERQERMLWLKRNQHGVDHKAVVFMSEILALCIHSTATVSGGMP